ncbi:3-dehydroquinate synthase [Alkalithermobacter thermoalcaliphilus JW-YL-7 = DSM 7308]|uniref:3-dehydroquinate synthase n=1 Tax=Alkalithermobacter thermoalcaliphilus JW-YL-7 = DSM 7308 TaxID=1121328 RepID=A0A150FPI1_CLOPD|nr:3-dehydroquinate synthase [[Clostridium] paradoxum JW-YL-7 = DSM 7308]SHL25343.1 3-dehydroquinate synthase [[Clostridium] paradoxum JW-YL-7 = DSM 7308]
MDKKSKIYISHSFDDILIDNTFDKILIVTDKNVENLYLKSILSKIQDKTYVYVIEPGEKSKTLDTYKEIFTFALEKGLTRKSLIIALGGGVVGDISGFVASTYMRGLSLLHCPTTLLSQVDSSIGGKTGINIGNFKNVMGTFYNADSIYINISTLTTLSDEDFISGMAEVIKYSLIWDYDFLDYLIYKRKSILDKDKTVLCNIVKKCIDIKSYIVENDHRETGLRKILNLGHSFGHGIERLGNLPHGYAVSIGTCMAFKLSLDRNLIGKNYYDKLINTYKDFGLPVSFEGISEFEILDIMKKDKKNNFSKYNLVLPVDFGKVQVFDDINEEEIISVIKEVKNDF